MTTKEFSVNIIPDKAVSFSYTLLSLLDFVGIFSFLQLYDLHSLDDFVLHLVSTKMTVSSSVKPWRIYYMVVKKDKTASTLASLAVGGNVPSDATLFIDTTFLTFADPIAKTRRIYTLSSPLPESKLVLSKFDMKHANVFFLCVDSETHKIRKTEVIQNYVFSGMGHTFDDEVSSDAESIARENELREEVDTKINSITQTVNTLHAMDSSINAQITTLKIDVAKVKGSTALQDGKIAQINTSVLDTNNKHDSLQSAFNIHKAAVTSIHSGFQSDISSLQTSSQSLLSAINAHQSLLDEKIPVLTALSNTVSSLNSEFSTHKTNILQALDAAKAEAQAGDTTLQTHISQIETLLGEHSGTFEAAITRIDDAINTLISEHGTLAADLTQFANDAVAYTDSKFAAVPSVDETKFIKVSDGDPTIFDAKSNKITNVGKGLNISDAATMENLIETALTTKTESVAGAQLYTDNKVASIPPFLPKTGISINLEGRRLENLGLPVLDTDAVSKIHLDTNHPTHQDLLDAKDSVKADVALLHPTKDEITAADYAPKSYVTSALANYTTSTDLGINYANKTEFNAEKQYVQQVLDNHFNLFEQSEQRISSLEDVQTDYVRKDDPYFRGMKRLYSVYLADLEGGTDNGWDDTKEVDPEATDEFTFDGDMIWKKIKTNFSDTTKNAILAKLAEWQNPPPS